MSVETEHTGNKIVFKIYNILPETCRTQMFDYAESSNGKISVEDYFRKRYQIQLKYSFLIIKINVRYLNILKLIF